MLDQLVEELAQFSDDPLGFVRFAYPWGELGPLENESLEFWQAEFLSELGDALKENSGPILMCATTGHGVGKSALLSMVLDWARSTHEDTKGVVTANTENQLKTKTWAEVMKWNQYSLTASLFDITATGIYSVEPTHAKTWRIDMVPWSERNTEAFAGLHNAGKRIIVIFDEASAIPDLIWEVTEGALTDKDTQIIWIAFGNPTRNTGRFRECFSPGGKFSHRWRQRCIDSRTVRRTNKIQLDKWIQDYGVDSDFTRVRILGRFPRSDGNSFISLERATEAAMREPDWKSPEPVVLGVDVGRGLDPSVIYPRKGNDAKSRPVKMLFTEDLMVVVSNVIAAYKDYSAQMIYVDAGGLGSGVVDRLRQLNYPVHEVFFAGSPEGVNSERGTIYFNKRAEIWGELRDWLRTGAISGDIPSGTHSLLDELTSVGVVERGDGKVQLQDKKLVRAEFGFSPNVADALAVTFAMPFFAQAGLRLEITGALVPLSYEDYDPFAENAA